jgi:hypothetical protein
VYVMRTCIHPVSSRLEIACIHTVESAMTCVRPASNPGMNDGRERGEVEPAVSYFWMCKMCK